MIVVKGVTTIRITISKEDRIQNLRILLMYNGVGYLSKTYIRYDVCCLTFPW